MAAWGFVLLCFSVVAEVVVLLFLAFLFLFFKFCLLFKTQSQVSLAGPVLTV